MTAALLFLVVAARPSTASGHALMVGPYSPFRAAMLAGLGLLGAAAATGLAGRGARLGNATLVFGVAALALCGMAWLGFLDAIVQRDWTLMRLPPTGETANLPATIVAFVRATLAVELLGIAGAALVWLSLRRRGAALRDVAVAGARLAIVAPATVLTSAGAWLAGRRRLAAAAVFGVVVVVQVLGARYQAGDVATFSVIGRLVLDGGVPYRDAWDIKFPGIYYVNAALQWLERSAAPLGLPFGVAAGVGSALLAALSVYAFYRVARAALPRAAAAVATVLFAVLANDPNLTAGGYLTECYTLLPALTAAFFAARALRRPQAWPSAALVGLAAAAASIVRPQAAATLAAFAVAVMVVMARRQLAPRRGAVLLLAAGVAFAAAWSVVLLALARAGALAHFLDLPIGFNGFMARAFPFTNRVAGMLAVANYLAVLLPLGVFGAWTASRVARVAPGARDAGFAAFALSWALVEVAGVLGIGRVVWHYLLEGIPAFCVLAGYALAAAPRVETPTRRMRIAAAVLVFQLAAGYVLYVARPAALVSEYPSLAPLVRFVREHTSPGDRIFVAGTPFGEAVHYYADRPPATRYLYFENAVSAYTRGRYLSEIEETLARRPPALLVTDARDDWYDSTLGRRRPVSSMIEARYPLVARIETPSATWLVFRPGAVAR